jgi:iron-sulfur cluster assembly accessory protein
MVTLTKKAVDKVKEILAAQQEPLPIGLRLGVRGGGCSGFQYALEFMHNEPTETDWTQDFDGLKVSVDQMSAMYLDGTELDYVETLEGAGFKFNNPNVTRTCGCGQSFQY